MPVDDTVHAPHVPPESLAAWLTAVRVLAEDVELEPRLSRPAIASRLRVLLGQMRAAAYRGTT